MEYYEKHVEESDNFVFKRNGNHNYPAHFHGNLEIYVAVNGNYDIIINKNKYNISNGQIAIIDSYAVHSYINKLPLNDNTNDFVIVIPHKYLNDFNSKRKNRSILNPVISNMEICKKLCDIFDNYFYLKPLDEQIASVNLMLAILYKNIKWQYKKIEDETELIRKILNYIQNNYRKNITRRCIARDLGYVEEHISRVFHLYVGKGIKEYINDLRLSYCENLKIEQPKKKIIDIIYESGFSSQQTYYRCLNRKNK